MTQQDKATAFAALHRRGQPVILYNIWDADSAKAVASQGASAIATSHHAIANSYGFEDGETMPVDLDYANMRRIVEAVDLPVTVDFETGYGTTPDEVYTSVTKALETGIVGINLEDRSEEGMSIRTLDDACARIAAARKAADDYDVALFINARTNLFAYASDNDKKSSDMIDQLIERAEAFAQAGGSGFFAPGINDIEQIRQLCEQSPLPVNIIWFPGFPSPVDLASAGASRISYGPGPYLSMIEWLKDGAKKALADQAAL